VPNEEDILAHPEQPRFLLSAWLWAVVLFVFFGAIVAIVFGSMPRGSTYEQDRARARMEKLKTAQEEWGKAANHYSWVDKDKGIARIPVQRAMEVTLAELQARKPMAAGPIATPAPAQAPASSAAQPTPPATTAPSGGQATHPPISVEGSKSENRGQPAAAANPPNTSAGTQPGTAATPAAKPNSASQIPPVSPTITPVQHPVGTPLPARGAPAASPGMSASPTPPGH
jgi:hypothetical protein